MKGPGKPLKDGKTNHMEDQHGFIGIISCSTNIIADEWTDTLEEIGSIDNIYLDFAKSFDTDFMTFRQKFNLYS